MKKIVSIILAACLTFGQIPAMVNAETVSDGKGVNAAMLDSILDGGDRHWVIETLVDDNWSNNPYNLVSKNNKPHGLAEDVLERYKNNALFKLEVDIMMRYYNLGSYMDQWVDDATGVSDELEEQFGSTEAANAYMKELCKGIDEQQYQAILNEVIRKNYTTTDGKTLRDREAGTSRYRMLQDLQTKTNTFIKKANALFDYYVDVEDAPNDLALAKNYVQIFSSTYNDLLDLFKDNFDKILEKHGDDDPAERAYYVKNVSILASALLTYGAYDDDTTTTFIGCEPLWQVFEDTYVPGVKAVFSAAGKAAKFTNTQLDNLAVQEALLQDGESLTGTLKRTAEQSGDKHYQKVVSGYEAMITEGYNNDVIFWQTVGATLNNRRPVQSLVEKKLKKSLTENLTLYTGLSTDPYSFSSSSIRGISLGVWLADQVVGLESTVKKTYELLYLQKILDYAIKVYQSDLGTYQGSQIEENAAKVLDDLAFIRRLRLRQENIAYNCAKGQLDSALGVLLSNGSEADQWEKMYQSSIDTLVMTDWQVLPDTKMSLSGGNLFLDYDSRYGGVYARYQSDSGIRTIPEILYQAAMGLELENVNVNILPTGSAWKNISLPYLDMTNGTLRIRGCTLNTGELYLNGTTVELCDTAASLQTGDMTVKNTELDAPEGTAIEADSLSVSGSLTAVGVQLQVNQETAIESGASVDLGDGELLSTDTRLGSKAKLKCKTLEGQTLSVGQDASVDAENVQAANSLELKNGAINGTTIAGGDVTGSGGTVTSLNLNGTVRQNVAGALQVTDLMVTNTAPRGVNLTGTLQVSGTAQDLLTRIWGGKNVMLASGCRILGSSYRSDVTLQGTTAAGVSFGGTVYVDKKATFGTGVVLKSGLANRSADTAALLSMSAGGDLRVGGTAYLNKLTIQGADDLYFGGDVYTKETVWDDDARVALNGKLEQTISGDGFTVPELTLTNHSEGGIDFQSTVQVNGTLHTDKDVKIGSSGLKLNGTVDGDTVNGNLTVLSLKDAELLTLSGTLSFGEQGVIWNSTLQIGKNLNLGNGTVQLEDTVLKVQGGIGSNGATAELNAGSTITAAGNGRISALTLQQGSIQIGGDAAISQFSGAGGRLVVCGDAAISQCTVEDGILELQGNVELTGSPSLAELILSGQKAQQVTGSEFTVKKLTMTNRGSGGVTFACKANVTETYTNDGVRLYQGENIHVLSQKNLKNGSISADELSYTEDCSLDTLNLVKNLEIDGCTLTVHKNLNLNGNVTIKNGGKLLVQGSMIQKNGSMQMDGDSRMEIRQDSIINTMKLSGGTLLLTEDALVSGLTADSGVLETKGDVTFSGTNQLSGLRLSGRRQTLSGSTVSVENLTLKNPLLSRVQLDCVLNVSGEYQNSSLGQVNSKENIRFVEKDGTEGEGSAPVRYTKDETVGSITVDREIVVESGTLTIRGNLTANKKVTVKSGAKLIVKGNVVQAKEAIIVDGELEIGGDLLLRAGTLSGAGAVKLSGDLSGDTGELKGLESLTLQGRTAQQVSGKAVQVTKLVLDNPSRQGVVLETNVTVKELEQNGNLTNQDKLIQQGENE